MQNPGRECGNDEAGQYEQGQIEPGVPASHSGIFPNPASEDIQEEELVGIVSADILIVQEIAADAVQEEKDDDRHAQVLQVQGVDGFVQQRVLSQDN